MCVSVCTRVDTLIAGCFTGLAQSPVLMCGPSVNMSALETSRHACTAHDVHMLTASLHMACECSLLVSIRKHNKYTLFTSRTITPWRLTHECKIKGTHWYCRLSHMCIRERGCWLEVRSQKILPNATAFLSCKAVKKSEKDINIWNSFKRYKEKKCSEILILIISLCRWGGGGGEETEIHTVLCVTVLLGK